LTLEGEVEQIYSLIHVAFNSTGVTIIFRCYFLRHVRMVSRKIKFVNSINSFIRLFHSFIHSLTRLLIH